jgi:hypothetical protein
MWAGFRREQSRRRCGRGSVSAPVLPLGARRRRDLEHAWRCTGRQAVGLRLQSRRRCGHRTHSGKYVRGGLGARCNDEEGVGQGRLIRVLR